MSVKTINISLDEREYQNALKKKGNRTWKQVLMDGLEKEVKQE
jgi:ribosomal protein L25 (general stress protein Ctc)